MRVSDAVSVCAGLLCLSTLIPTAAIAGRSEASAALRKTLDAYRSDGDAGAARVGFLEALEIDPTYPSPQFNLGVLAQEQRRWAEAVKWFESFLAVEPRSSRHFAAATKRLQACRAAVEIATTPEGSRVLEYAALIARARNSLRIHNSRKAFMWAAQAAVVDGSQPESYILGAAALIDIAAYRQALMMVDQGLAKVSRPDQKQNLQELRLRIASHLPPHTGGKVEDAATSNRD